MANWEPGSSRQIRQRYVITGQLVLDTPASFSNGETSGTEIVILEDAVDGGPLLPGASLAGALRQYVLTREQGYRTEDASTTLATQLFGEALDNDTVRMESRVIVADAPGEGQLTRREGVKIAGATRTADEGMLFSTQVWEVGTTFKLCFELVVYEDDKDELAQAFAAALQALGTGEIPLGGRKQRGYGRVHVADWHVCHYDLANPKALGAWLRGECPTDDTQVFFAAAHLADRRQYVRVDATFRLCDSLLIRAESDFAQKEHLTSGGQPVLSGTSLAGALRARALKIAKTVNPTYGAELVDDLFGQHGAEGNSESLSASRVRVEERPITGGMFDYIQNRAKIDRFTGGAFETALFDERPLFAQDGTYTQIQLELRYPADEKLRHKLNAQVGLLLLTLKDLWTEDLPLGGEASVGRGRLHGQSATLYFKLTNESRAVKLQLNEHGAIETPQSEGMEEEYKNQLVRLGMVETQENKKTYVQALWDYREMQS